LSVPSKEDSGTESGEDLRLLAAGLRDTLQQRSGSDASEANRSLVEEVTDALSRLESSLKQGKELAVDGGQRQALLGLVARLQSGLSAPEKLADDRKAAEDPKDADGGSPEPETDSRQSRFAKRRQRNSRHTVGVSREELADARRYMEDMLILEGKDFALTKTPSSSAVPVQLYRPNQFVAQPPQQQQQQQQQQSQPQSATNPPNATPSNPTQNQSQLRPNTTNRRPLSGDYAVSFASYEANQNSQNSSPEGNGNSPSNSQSNSNSSSNSSRFGGGKKHLMKRANTIDIPKAKAKYMADCDSDSDLEEDHGPHLGLKRAVQVSVKRRVHNAVPPFEPKTENDHKFLAFINKQSHQTGLGWSGGGGRSVSNWTHKFGNIKHTFETGAAATATKGKPPPVPGHVPGWAKQEQLHHQQLQREQMQREQIQREQYQREQRQREQRELGQRDLKLQLQREQLQREQYQREQGQRELSKREQFQREQLQREQLQREQLQREKLQREQLQREQLQREQLQREQLQLEQLQRDQLQREQLQRDQLQLQQQQQAAAAVQIERQRRQELERQLRIEQEARYEREERTRLEREYYEQQLQRQQAERQQQLDRQRQQQEQLERQRRQEMELRLQQQREQAAQVNNFIHAPQSVFRPIENEAPPQPGI